MTTKEPHTSHSGSFCEAFQSKRNPSQSDKAFVRGNREIRAHSQKPWWADSHSEPASASHQSLTVQHAIITLFIPCRTTRVMQDELHALQYLAMVFFFLRFTINTYWAAKTQLEAQIDPREMYNQRSLSHPWPWWLFWWTFMRAWQCECSLMKLNQINRCQWQSCAISSVVAPHKNAICKKHYWQHGTDQSFQRIPSRLVLNDCSKEYSAVALVPGTAALR